MELGLASRKMDVLAMEDKHVDAGDGGSHRITHSWLRPQHRTDSQKQPWAVAV
jgi:hypothetical protein